MQIFGKELFNFKKEPGLMWNFAQWGLIREQFMPVVEMMIEARPTPKQKPKKEAKKVFLTPKALYEMKALNDNKFSIRIDKKYLDKEIEDLKYKLGIMGGKNKKQSNRGQELQMTSDANRVGRDEIESIIERLENRFRIEEFKNTLDKYPYTTNNLINKVVHKDSNLRCQNANDFVPDFPKVAMQAIDEYNKMCLALCNKKAVFYVIASKEDFGEVQRRRDPILLVQSPFGFFWQILGAWDKEMIYLGDL